MARKKKTDTEVLFPEVVYDFSIGKITVRPLTYGDVIDFSSNLQEILIELETKGILIDYSAMKISLPDIFTIYISLAKPASPILARLTDKSEEEIRKLTMSEAAQLIVTIIQQNLEIFIRFFGQLFSGASPTTTPENEEVTEKTEEIT